MAPENDMPVSNLTYKIENFKRIRKLLFQEYIKAGEEIGAERYTIDNKTTLKLLFFMVYASGGTGKSDLFELFDNMWSYPSGAVELDLYAGVLLNKGGESENGAQFGNMRSIINKSLKITADVLYSDIKDNASRARVCDVINKALDKMREEGVFKMGRDELVDLSHACREWQRAALVGNGKPWPLNREYLFEESREGLLWQLQADRRKNAKKYYYVRDPATLAD
jgi:hypothetical protein